MKVSFEVRNKVCIVSLNRPEVRNAVDRDTATQLADAFRRFEQDNNLAVAVLYGTGGNFCAGADLRSVAEVFNGGGHRLDSAMTADGPMGPTRLHLSKPVIGAVSGYAVAGGLELALWCDLRVAERDSVFGVFCRRFGVPLIDGGTQRLPRLIGMSRALDLVLTGRPVGAEEALAMGLVNRLVEPSTSLDEAIAFANQIASFPQMCMRSDRASLYTGFDLPFAEAMQLEFTNGLNVIQSGETEQGARRFVGGEGRHGQSV